MHDVRSAPQRLRSAAKPEWAGLVGILVVGLVLRIVFWYGFVNVDPFAYADGAASLARNKPVFDPEIVGSLYYTQYIRFSLVAPAGLLYAIFGPSEIVSTVFPIACSLGSAIVAYLLALKAVPGDRRAGLMAAFLAGLFPLAVINSTQFLPDTVMAFFAALAVLLFWHGVDSGDERWQRRALLFFATGVAWGMALYGRQTALGLALPFVALLIARRRVDPALLAGIPGGLLMLLVMNILLVTHGGEPLEDVRTALNEGRGSQPGALGYTDLDWSYARTLLTDRDVPPNDNPCNDRWRALNSSRWLAQLASRAHGPARADSRGSLSVLRVSYAASQPLLVVEGTTLHLDPHDYRGSHCGGRALAGNRVVSWKNFARCQECRARGVGNVFLT